MTKPITLADIERRAAFVRESAASDEQEDRMVADAECHCLYRDVLRAIAADIGDSWAASLARAALAAEEQK